MNYAIIFDLDGVLVTSDRCHYLAWKRIADELNIPFDEQRNNLLRGVSRRESLMIILGENCTLNDAEIDRLLEKKNLCYRNFVQEIGSKILLPGVIPLLDALRAEGFKLAIASSSRNTPMLLDVSGLDRGYFDAIADGNDITRSKPDPEVFLLAAERVDVPPRRCLVIEDAAAGVEGARAAGMGVLGIGRADMPACDLNRDSLEATSVDDIRSVLFSAGKEQ